MSSGDRESLMPSLEGSQPRGRMPETRYLEEQVNKAIEADRQRAIADLRLHVPPDDLGRTALVHMPIVDLYNMLPDSMHPRERNLRAFLYACGLLDSDTNLTQLNVFVGALQKFGERNQRYKDVWKESGWKGSLFDMRKKLTRLWRVFWRGEPTEQIDLECDDAYDLINFTAFFIRNVKDGNQWGQWG